MTVYTIGHSTRSTDELVNLLEQTCVDMLVDIRSFPRSRTNPQFNADRLPESLAERGIGYRHLAALGGRRGGRQIEGPSPNAFWQQEAFRNYADYALTPEFHAGLDELLDLARAHTVAIMCAEAVWWRCHRRIVTDYLLARGIKIRHIIDREHVAPADMTPEAQVQPDRTIHYPPRQGSLL